MTPPPIPITLTLLIVLSAPTVGAPDQVAIPPAPDGIPTTPHWQVLVNREPVPVYSAIVFRGGPAFFCNLDLQGPAHIEARPAWPVRNALVRPLSRNIIPTIEGQSIHFDIPGPGFLSIEPNHLTTHPLFLFANPIEDPAPDPDDPNVIQFLPGLHILDHSIRLKSGQEVYLHPGAWVRAVMPTDETPQTDPRGAKRYAPLFHADNAENVTIRGRGTLDLSHLDWHARAAICIVGSSHARLEGLTILDPPGWTINLSNSEHVDIQNIKLIGHRQSNDGIDIVNSRDINIRHCFTRVGDDGIIAKTFPNGGETAHILVEDCVMWNDKCRTIGITSETARPIHDVTFRNIDIIHDLTTDFAMAWTIAIYMEDCGPITDILFDDIRCEDTQKKFIQLAITKGEWATTDQLGPIERVRFNRIQYLGANLPRSEIRGNDAKNHIKDVQFHDLTMNGRTILDAQSGNIDINDHAYDITFSASE